MKRVLVVLALLLVPGIALATPQINFDNPTLDGGTLTYDGLGGAAVGTDVIFQQVIGVDTPLNSGISLFCNPTCLLDFSTGPNITEGPPIYTWGGGGSLTLTGGLYTSPGGGGVNIVPDGSLLAHTGNFNAPSVGLTGGVDSMLFAAGGFDLKNELLIAFYGLTNPAFNFANTELSLNNTVFLPNGGFNAVVNDADFSNTAVPEPATLLLLGTGLVGAGAFNRRMRRQKLPV